MSEPRDLIILGGGAAGTAAALTAGAAGLDVVLVEPGRSRRRREAETALTELLAHRPLSGAPVERREAGWQAAVRRAGEAAAASADRRDRRLTRAGVARVTGVGRLSAEPGQVTLGATVLRARHVLVATGSRPGVPEGCETDDGVIFPRGRLLDLEAPPARALVVGCGLDASALAGLFAEAGTEVALAGGADRLLPAADPDVSAAVARSLEAAGVAVHVGRRPLHLARDGKQVRLRLEGEGDEEGLAISADIAFAPEGSRPARSGCGLDSAAPELPEILPEQSHAAGREDLLVAGSVTGRALVPEQAAREGRAAVERLLGRQVHVPYAAVPKLASGAAGCGWTGLTEPQARAAGHALKIGRAQLPGSGRLRPGFVKLLSDSSSNRVLGVHAAGGRSREAVLLGAVAVESGASLLDLAAFAFPEDTAAAALVEAARTAEPA